MRFARLVAGLGALALVVAAAWFATSPRARDARPVELEPRSERLPAPVDLAQATRAREAERLDVLETDVGASPRFELAGRVLDLEARAVEGVAVVHVGFDSETPLGSSDASGAFHGAVERLEGRLVVRSSAWVTVPREGVRASRGREHVLSVSRSAVLAGRVLDQRGDAVCGARIVLRPSSATLAAWPANAGPASEEWPVALSGVDGSFFVADAPQFSGSTLRATCEPLSPCEVELPTGAGQGLLLVLRDPSAGELLQGVVQDQRLLPVEGAFAALGEFAASPTAADGRFRIAIESRAAVSSQALIVEGPSRLEVHYDAQIGSALASCEGALPFVRVVLREALELKVCVERRDGRPVRLQSVAILDKTRRRAGLEAGAFLEQDTGYRPSPECATLLRLLERPYMLAIDVASPPVSFEFGPVRPSSSALRIPLPAGLEFAPRDVRVLTPDGRPAVGARVAVRARGSRATRSSFKAAASGGVSVCDANGDARIEECPNRGAWIVACAADHAPAILEVEHAVGTERSELYLAHNASLLVRGLSTGRSRVRARLLDSTGAWRWCSDGARALDPLELDLEPELELWTDEGGNLRLWSSVGACRLRVRDRWGAEVSASSDAPEPNVLFEHDIVLEPESILQLAR
ncbi:MAG: hypothetical protein IT454_06020 [Planctomycetes bacterium]|nr:hypothetical protein [Planctomycetota bacterium]